MPVMQALLSRALQLEKGGRASAMHYVKVRAVTRASVDTSGNSIPPGEHGLHEPPASLPARSSVPHFFLRSLS